MTQSSIRRTGSNVFVPSEVIENRILLIRGQKVMLDKHLADLYQIQPTRLREQVKRNWDRFPVDFMFQLTQEEVNFMVSHFAIPSMKVFGGHLPYVFTQEGVAMLSSVLNSPRAVQVNIAIMRAFVKLRELMISHKDLACQIEELEKKFNKHDENFVLVFQAIKQLLEGSKESRKKKLPIGFHVK